MAAAETRLHRPEAIAIASAFVDALDGCYTELKVAGSLRRRLAYVGDIEVVCVPRIDTIEDGLWGDRPSRVDRLDERLELLLRHHEVEKRLDRNGVPRWGPTLKYLSCQGARIDLFSPSAERFGWILLLRTGPAAFSRQLVVPTDRRTKDGRPGLCPPTIRAVDGWLTDRTSGRRIETPTEQDAFAALDLPYVEPWDRT